MNMLRIAVICNNRMALPSLQFLAQQRVLAGIGIPETNLEVTQDCQMLFRNSGISVHSLKHKTLLPDTQNWLGEIKANLVWLMTFPWKIPQELLNLKEVPFYNFHFGLLPQMRGVDPIFECIRRKEIETGITVHLVTPKIDDGPVLMVQKIPLNMETTHGSLCSEMAANAAHICARLLPLFEKQPSPPTTPQSEENVHYYGRPGLTDVLINWDTMDSLSVSALVRACNPWNKGAYVSYKNWNFRVLSVSDYGDSQEASIPGTIVKGEDGSFLVHCLDRKLLKINIIYIEEGFFEGIKLFNFGVRMNDLLK